MTKKLLALGLSLTMALSLAACGGDSSSAASTSGSNTDASTSQSDASTGDTSTAGEITTAEEGKLILGTSADYPPFGHLRRLPPLRVPHPGRERRGPDRGSGCGPGPPDRRGHGPGV